MAADQGNVLDPGVRVRIPDHVIHRSFAAETVALNLETGHYHGINATGGRIMDLLRENGGDVDAAAECLAAEHGHEVQEVAPDVREFCAALAQRGLAEVVRGKGE